MDIEVTFPGGKWVAAQVGNHVVVSDQPVAQGGQDAAPAPFELLLASIATCAGSYALAFLQARALSTEGLRLHQHVELDPTTQLPTSIQTELTLPPGLPDKYRNAVLRAVETCKVKAALAAMPRLEVSLRGHEEQAVTQIP